MEKDFTRSENIFYFIDNFTSFALMENSDYYQKFLDRAF